MKNSPNTRALLLDAAKVLFMKKSYESVSIREIAEYAKVNSAMIAYYFGSKAGLYNEMISELFWLKKSHHSDSQPEILDTEEWLTQSLYNFYVFFHENKEHRNILINSLTSKNEQIRNYFIECFLGRNKALFVTKMKSKCIDKNSVETLWMNITSITIFPLLSDDIIKKLLIKKEKTLLEFYMSYASDTAKIITRGALNI